MDNNVSNNKNNYNNFKLDYYKKENIKIQNIKQLDLFKEDGQQEALIRNDIILATNLINEIEANTTNKNQAADMQLVQSYIDTIALNEASLNKVKLYKDRRNQDPKEA